MKLTDISVRKASADPARATKMRDEGGLMLEISPGGLKTWRLRTRVGKKDTTATLGHYPAMSLADARRARDMERGKITPDLTPAPAPSFEVVAREWHATNKSRWTARHAARVIYTLEQEIFAALGPLAVDTITAATIMPLLKGIEARGKHDHAHDVRQRVEGVFWYAIAAGHCKTNPAASMSRVMVPIPPGKPRPAVIELDAARKLLADVEAVPGGPVVRLAHRFLTLTAQRPGEVRAACWSEFEGLEGAEPVWKIPAAHMKMKKAHAVPLSPQAVAVLAELKKFSGKFALAFPSNGKPNTPISGTAMSDLIERAGYAGQHVPHGWRAAFSTIMNTRRPNDRAVIDLMLAHVSGDKVESAYNRAEHWQTRVEIAAEWADLILEGRGPVAELSFLPRYSKRTS